MSDTHTITPHSFVVLASRSPRRAALVRLLGIGDVRVRPSDVDETVDESLAPEQQVTELALRKSRVLLKELRGEPAVIVGADTMVVLGEATLNKPADPADAIWMLSQLSGNTHTVYTGVALIDAASGEELTFVVYTDVTFRTLERWEIEQYVAGGSPMDKAGAYGIQEDFGAVFVSRIDGDYYNVVGLPLCELYRHLRAFAPSVFAR